MKKMQIIFRSLLTVAMLLSGGSMMAAATKTRVRSQGVIDTALLPARATASQAAEAKQQAQNALNASLAIDEKSRDEQAHKALVVAANTANTNSENAEKAVTDLEAERAESPSDYELALAKELAKAFGVNFDENDRKIVDATTKGGFNDAWLKEAGDTLKTAQEVPTKDKDNKDLGRFAQLRAKVKIFFTTRFSVLGKEIASKFKDSTTGNLVEEKQKKFLQVFINAGFIKAMPGAENKNKEMNSAISKLAKATLKVMDAKAAEEKAKAAATAPKSFFQRHKKAIFGGFATVAAAAAVYLKFFRNK